MFILVLSRQRGVGTHTVSDGRRHVLVVVVVCFRIIVQKPEKNKIYLINKANIKKNNRIFIIPSTIHTVHCARPNNWCLDQKRILKRTQMVLLFSTLTRSNENVQHNSNKIIWRQPNTHFIPRTENTAIYIHTHFFSPTTTNIYDSVQR